MTPDAQALAEHLAAAARAAGVEDQVRTRQVLRVVEGREP